MGYSFNFILTPAWIPYVTDYTASELCGVYKCLEPQLPFQLDFPLTCTELSVDTNIDSSSFIPDLTTLCNMKAGELLKKELGHLKQFQGKVMSGGDEMGS